MAAHEHHEPRSVEWYTPPHVFAALELEFDLDPCSPGSDVVPWVPAREHYTIRDDGLTRPWHGRVWCHPPFGDVGPRFVGRMIEHGHGVLLMPARTSSRWFHSALERADALCLLYRRLDCIAGAGQPVSRPAYAPVLFAFGGDCATAVEASGLGATVIRSNAPHPAQMALA